ncbi:MAG: hypothetical protein AABZ09_03185, partial [Candidatus Binatota bacterium]
MKVKRRRILVTLALLFLSAVRPPISAALTVRVGYPQLSGGSMPLWVITDSKLDQRYGVDVKPIYIAGGATLTHSLIAGDVDIALTGGAVVGAVLSGADLVYAGIGLSTYAFTVYSRPDIKEINDLRGKVFGVITKGASSDHAVPVRTNTRAVPASAPIAVSSPGAPRSARSPAAESATAAAKLSKSRVPGAVSVASSDHVVPVRAKTNARPPSPKP